ncbi:MAG: hypothetical protein E6I87_07005 [Chloroflexi bacterium]|nr:MAG: hypothetical protein E6I87_07005 [Chloroflexota bacterium]
MTLTTPAGEALRDATDADSLLRAALEASLRVTDAERGLVVLADLGTGRIYAVQSLGLQGEELDRQRPVPLGGPRHPVAESLRDGEFRHVFPISLARNPLARLGRLGLRSATVVPVPLEVTVSPCLVAGRCLEKRCLVRERTASASPDGEWQRRVTGSCQRAHSLRSPAALVLDVHRLSPQMKLALHDIADHAGQMLARLPVLPIGTATPSGEADEEWQRRAFAAVDEPVLVADASGNLSFTNGPAHRLFVAGASDAEGRRRAVDFNRMLLSAWLAAYVRTPEASRPRELALVDPEDGSELLFELLSTTAYNAVARETGTVVVMKDVSDLRHAAEELQASLRRVEANEQSARREGEQLRLVLERIDQAIVVADPRGEGEGVLASEAMDVLRMNHAARRLLQAEQDAPERRREIVSRNDAIVTSFISQAEMSGGEAAAELALTDPYGEQVRSFAAHAGVARDQVGAAVAIVCVLADLTELRELERRRVERQLFESEKLAATGRLAASFAHEINNPLEAMKNALYLVGEDLPAKAAARRYVQIATTETDRISKIVRQILGFYRPSVVRAPVELNAIISEVVDLLRLQLRKARVEVRLELEPSLARIVASADQLRQILLNLTLNSTQAMPDGGEITIGTRAARHKRGAPAGAAESVILEIADNGPGIAPDVRDRLFEPFVTTKERGGTGLGLWICREIIQAHSGTIRVEAVAPRGTRFVISLPVRRKEER